MKKLYDSDDLKRKENRTPHVHFTWAGLIVPVVIAAVIILGIFIWANYS